MIVFQAEHNILMHPFHMLGDHYAPPSVQHSLLIDSIDYKDSWTFLGLQSYCVIWIPKNLVNDKRGIETRLNGGSPRKSLIFYASSSNLDANEDNFYQDNPVPNRIPPRQLPGVYMILCLANNKRYYGQSKNVSSRLSQHKSKLRRNIHEIPELQRDFNLYGEENFEFSCLYISRDADLNQRVAMETELIGRFFASGLVYNTLDKSNYKKENNPFWGHTHSKETIEQMKRSQTDNRKHSPLEGFAILLKGEVYSSISEASRQTSHSRDTIRRWLRDPDSVNCVAIDVSKPSMSVDDNPQGLQDSLITNTGTAKPVSLYGIEYPSIAEAARQRNCGRKVIQSLLRSHPDECFIISF